MPLLKTIALIVAAGQGRRMGGKGNKQYLPLGHKPVLAHTLEVFQQHPMVDGILVVVAKDEIGLCQSQVIQAYGLNRVIKVIAGGKERQDSVYQGLLALPEECNLVVVHDGARPLVTPEIITEAIKSAQTNQASLVAVPLKDTIKRIDEEGFVVETLVRSELVSVQTPQVFLKEIILRAYEQAFKEGFLGTDDASLVERLGIPIRIVHGSYENIKITTPEDLDIAHCFLRREESCE